MCWSYQSAPTPWSRLHHQHHHHHHHQNWAKRMFLKKDHVRSVVDGVVLSGAAVHMRKEEGGKRKELVLLMQDACQ